MTRNARLIKRADNNMYFAGPAKANFFRRIPYRRQLASFCWLIFFLIGIFWIIPNQAIAQGASVQTGIIQADIRLGQKKQDIVAEFGAPQRIKSEGKVYDYGAYGISLYFDEQDQVQLIYMSSDFQGLLNGRSLSDISLGSAMQAFGGTDHVLRKAYTPSGMIQSKSTVETEFLKAGPGVLPLEYRGQNILYELFSHDMVMKYKYVLDEQGVALWFDHNRQLYSSAVYYPEHVQQETDLRAEDDCQMQLADAFEMIFFEFDEYAIQKEHIPVLEKYVHFLSEYPEIKVVIQGHTDSFGSEAYNIDLSHKRAKAVQDYFTKRGVSSDRLETTGHAYFKPIARNTTEDGQDNPEGRALNRRAELRLKTGK